MRKTMRNALVVAAALIPLLGAVTVAQMNSKPATYITKEEVDTVNKTPGVDRTIRVVDIGPENFAVGIIHRGSTRTPPAGGAGGGGGARGGAQAAPDCGMLTGNPAPAGTPSGIAHDSQTEGYYIVSGAGEMVTGGHIHLGRHSAADAQVTTELNGPSCSGAMLGDVVKRQVKVGDIIIIPAGTPHGWSDIPDHVDYLSFRPSQKVLTAGYVHPSIKK
jgi:mannose-6-phosphate isomerase-like protein (cupin superfamily)